MIKIVTGSIRSGKTTSLERWLRSAGADGVAGFLTPDGRDGRKVLRFIPTGETLPFETPCDSPEQTVDIGPFCFLASTFEYARTTLQRVATTPVRLAVVDELGKLELRGSGFEPALSRLISAYRELPEHLLVLVIRDFLIGPARERYGLPQEYLDLRDDPSG
ncbi:MAG: nucleoside-triphosphatase [Spirochaetales bacterium]